MKKGRFRFALLSTIAGALVLTTVPSSRADSESKSAGPRAQTISIPVEGMSCVSCAARIKRAQNNGRRAAGGGEIGRAHV